MMAGLGGVGLWLAGIFSGSFTTRTRALPGRAIKEIRILSGNYGTRGLWLVEDFEVRGSDSYYGFLGSGIYYKRGARAFRDFVSS